MTRKPTATATLAATLAIALTLAAGPVLAQDDADLGIPPAPSSTSTMIVAADSLGFTLASLAGAQSQILAVLPEQDRTYRVCDATGTSCERVTRPLTNLIVYRPADDLASQAIAPPDADSTMPPNPDSTMPPSQMHTEEIVPVGDLLTTLAELEKAGAALVSIAPHQRWIHRACTQSQFSNQQQCFQRTDLLTVKVVAIPAN